MWTVWKLNNPTVDWAETSWEPWLDFSFCFSFYKDREIINPKLLVLFSVVPSEFPNLEHLKIRHLNVLPFLAQYQARARYRMYPKNRQFLLLLEVNEKWAVLTERIGQHKRIRSVTRRRESKRYFVRGKQVSGPLSFTHDSIVN